MHLIRATIALLLCLLAFGSAITVRTPSGIIEGKSTKLADIFLSIPYAESPTGVNRFKEVSMKTPWQGTLQALVDPPGCPQVCELPPHTCPERYSEDCLFLNVFTPSGASTSSRKLPVLVYFHGGNYKQGYAGGPLYFGDRLVAQTNTIIVVPNYRLGALGYLAAPEMGIAGNAALHDQRLSLQWVQQHIGSFGGDKDAVTISGQSAGAGSVATHLISPPSQGLFHRAWMFSNPFAIPFRAPASMPQLAKVFLNYTQCADAMCLRGLPVDELVAAQAKSEVDVNAMGDSVLHAFLPWTPYVDGQLVPDYPIRAFANGRAADVPVVLGVVHDEALIFIHEAFTDPVDSLTYAFFATMVFGVDRGLKVLSRFPALNGTDVDQRARLTELGSQFIFNCALRNATHGLLASGRKQPVFQYMYDHSLSFGKDAWGDQFAICADPAITCHAAELPLFWNSAQDTYAYQPQEIVFAGQLGQYLGNFAWTGRPDQGPVPPTPAGARMHISEAGVASALHGLLSDSELAALFPADAPAVSWPEYRTAGQSLILELGKIRAEVYMRTECDFWDSIGY